MQSPTRHTSDGPNDAQQRVLGLLAALGDVEVDADDVAGIAGLPDAVPVLEKLRSRRLVDGDGARYRLAAPAGPGPRHDAVGAAWMPLVLGHLLARYEQSASAPGTPDRPATVVDDLELVLAAVEWAMAARRWEDVVRLVRAVDPPLAMSRQWGAWEMVLLRGLEAARAGGDRGGEAWVLHQLGTRSLGLGDAGAARRHLTSAVALRESLGDRRGAAVSRRNLVLSEAATS
ncbi:MAG TPA: hypothetical protein VM263_02915 [Acidimicrobiales bacterium]|jgi:hypothetical protein|nr:hypothetical protein [Acidimicrobiales bacterium]